MIDTIKAERYRHQYLEYGSVMPYILHSLGFQNTATLKPTIISRYLHKRILQFHVDFVILRNSRHL